MLSLPPEKIKNLLIRDGVIDAGTFDMAFEESSRKNQNVIDLLISRGLIGRGYFFSLLAKSLGVERIDLTSEKIDERILRLLPEEVARQRRAVVFANQPDGSFKVAMEDPTNLETIDFLALRLGAPIRPFLATDDDLIRGFLLYERRLTQDFQKIIEKSVKDSLRSKLRGDLKEAASDVPVVALVDNLLSYAVSSRASDIHFEILEDTVLVRFRIDGILREIVRMPIEIHPPIVARLKILAGLRIDEHSRPQDGRFRHKIMNSAVDVRISAIPAFYGEKIVLRLLVAAKKPLSLADLGMLEDQVKIVNDAVEKSYGIILICGPTGAGKTTTLYSIMNILNRPEVNIITVEDPIEYDMRYLNQIQVNVAAGITFASGLRSILRQDPDIIMVGEIRDDETAGISVQAALTGHLVLSSLHTNDSPTAIPRLVDMGVQPFLLAAVINAITSQRLVRRIHTACVESYEPDEGIVKSIANQLRILGIDDKGIKPPKTVYRGRGCAGCGNSGYSGQLGIFEILPGSEEVRKIIVEAGFTLDRLRALARKEGMITMFEDGLRKVERGLTTIEEIFRVIQE